MPEFVGIRLGIWRQGEFLGHATVAVRAVRKQDSTQLASRLPSCQASSGMLDLRRICVFVVVWQVVHREALRSVIYFEQDLDVEDPSQIRVGLDLAERIYAKTAEQSDALGRGDDIVCN